MGDLADCSIVGGLPEQRLTLAIKVRRIGISCFTETHTRKKSRAVKKAVLENCWGIGGVYDIDDPEDREWLERDDLAEVGV